MSQFEIRVAGLGGQGVILCAMIIGKAASIYAGKSATLIQSFGPEARGSACSAQLIIADAPIGYPYVRGLDILVVMSQDACAKFLPELRPGGLLLFESELVAAEQLPEGARSAGIPATRFAEELGRKLVMNIVMAGFFARVTELFPLEAMEKAVRDSVPPRTEELNLVALRKGWEFGGQALATPATGVEQKS